MSKTLQIMLITILTIATIVVGRFAFKKLNKSPEVIEPTQSQHEISEEHCRMMPTMPGCEIYNTTWDDTMDHAAMITDINSYLHEMIPHHQEAVDTSKILLEKTLFSGDNLDSPLPQHQD